MVTALLHGYYEWGRYSARADREGHAANGMIL